MNHTIQLKRVNELIGAKFFIPAYQRGYRWTQENVENLLNDIKDFVPKQITDTNEKTWYCLQPIIVKPKSENEWEVIDGQQRLTTIYLILHYLNQRYTEKNRKKLFELVYATRNNSEDFLKNQLNEEIINEDNIDYFFISSAYKVICEWFTNQKTLDVNDYESKFNFHAKVIWYEVSPNQDSIDIFTRINIGKIPLTNAELIKALFLNSSNFKNADAEKLRLKQLEIASEWDRIEYELQDDSFWYFLTDKNDLETRIELIFNLIANKITNDKYSTFNFYYDKFKNYNSEKDIQDHWLEVKNCFQTLKEWYEEKELYHKIGYLLAIGTEIDVIYKGNKDKTKREFKDFINQKIKNSLQGINLKEVEYGNGNIRKILLLHNVQTMLNNQNETVHFPFVNYKKEKWDIEHIHAIATKVKIKKEDLPKWLKNNFVKTGTHQDNEMNDKIQKIINDNITTIEDIEIEKIVNYVLGEEDNSLSNLCLLDKGTNREYKNASFKEKRSIIIEKDKNSYFIPICTKNVFMKYYSEDAKDLELWNVEDKNAYFENIKGEINKYLENTKHEQ